MPDPSGKTVSASQVASIFNLCPYQTRYMLYAQFTMPPGQYPEKDDDERMEAGRYFEPGILQWTADRLRLEVTPNAEQHYVSQGPIGATIDATVNDPQRGPGVVEAKNVDYLRHQELWTDTAAPKHIELQVQAELLATGYEWAIIACCVGGNTLKLYERAPMPAIQSEIIAEAEAFLEQVRGERPPPKATGSPRELPVLDALYPEVEPERWKFFDEDQSMTELYEEFRQAQREEGLARKRKDGAKARLLAAAEDCGAMKIPGYEIYVRKTQVAGTANRKGHVRTTIKDRELPELATIRAGYMEAYDKLFRREETT